MGCYDRHAGVPRPHRRRRSRALAERPEGADDRSRAAITACWRCRRCRRRCTFLPACWRGTRSAGASGFRSLRIGALRSTPRCAIRLRGGDRFGETSSAMSVRAVAVSRTARRRGCASCSGSRSRWPRSTSRSIRPKPSIFIRVLERVFGPDPVGGRAGAAGGAARRAVCRTGARVARSDRGSEVRVNAPAKVVIDDSA